MDIPKTGREPVLNSLPKFWLDDRRVLAGVDFLLVRDVAPIKSVLHHKVKRAAREALAAGKLSVGSLPSPIPRQYFYTGRRSISD
jgi:hypothetical protein